MSSCSLLVVSINSFKLFSLVFSCRTALVAVAAAESLLIYTAEFIIVYYGKRGSSRFAVSLPPLSESGKQRSPGVCRFFPEESSKASSACQSLQTIHRHRAASDLKRTTLNHLPLRELGLSLHGRNGTEKSGAATKHSLAHLYELIRERADAEADSGSN